MSKANSYQTERLNSLLKISFSDKDRAAFLLAYTNNRTHEVTELKHNEAEELLQTLKKSVKMATPEQIKKLQWLYRELKLTEHKKELLLHFTDGRTDSTAGLTMNEARDLIQDLAQHEPTERLRKAIFSFARKSGMLYGETEVDKKINLAKLNMFLRERGAVKKDIERQTLDELKMTLAQFAAMIANNHKTAINKAAQASTHELLKELGMNVQK